jgi:hypothetical protein
MFNNSLKIKLLTTLFFCSFYSFVKCQGINHIQDVNSLNISIDIYYNNINNNSVAELKQSNKYRWLAYLPTPSYYPAFGKFGISMNLLAPLQEFRQSSQFKAKSKSIIASNQIEAEILKASVLADYRNIESQIKQYQAKFYQDSLQLVSFGLFENQYIKNEILPSDYLNLLKANAQYWDERKINIYTINRFIDNLHLKAKMDVYGTSILTTIHN